MVQNDLRVKLVSKAAVYGHMHRLYTVRRRWFLASQAFFLAVVLILSVVLQTYLQIKPPTYKLDDATYSLIGESRDDTAKYLTSDEQEAAFKFVLPEESDTDGKQHSGRSADAYEATLATNAKQGITYTDTASNIGVTIKPLFRTGEGKKVDGDHIVYPMGAQKLIYTLKYNGLKEDIIVPKYLGDELDYEFELSLPSGVEARLDRDGNIGIFSSDTSLFGDISFGSDEDRARVDKAREKGEKNNLVVTIPSPIVKDADGKEHSDKASFILGEKRSEQVETANEQKNLPAEVRQKLNSMSMRNVYSLKLAAKDLKDLPYPISLDPTIRTSSASDWQKGIVEGNVAIDSDLALIKRGGLTGGVVPSFTAQTPTWTARGIAGGFVNDGKLFMLGGVGDSTVWYVAIASDGTIGSTWTQSASTLPASDYNGYGVSIYNGYLYLSGGQLSGSTVANTYYIKIKSLISTTVSTSFTAGTSLPSPSAAPGSVAYNGYLYILGGRFTSTSLHASIWISKLKADGSHEAWSTSSSTLSTDRWQLAGFAYNGRIYYGGGCDTNGGALSSDCGTPMSDVWSAPLGSDGSVGTFVQMTSFTTARGGLSLTATNGYAYVAGGCSAVAGTCSSGSVLSDVQYAQINSDGSLGTWRATSSLATGRYFSASAVYQGNLYYMGGCNTPSNSACNETTSFRSVEYVKVRVAGSTGTFSATSTLSGRLNAGTAASDGFIYVIGGCSTTTCKDSDGVGQGYRKDIQYAPINAAGTIGNWTTSSSTIPATGTSKAGRMDFYAVANNGYIYIIGGFACNTLCTGDDHKADILVGKLSPSGGITGSGMSIGACVTQDFCAASNSLPLARSRHAALAHGDYLYVMGGYDGSNTLSSGAYASFGTGGDLNAFSATTSFDNSSSTAIRGYFPMVEHAGNIYAIGGYNATVSRSDIQKAAVNSDGSLGSWSITGNSALPAARHATAAAVANGRLYVMGGGNGDNNVQSTVYIGDFASDGTISGWTTSPNSMATGRGSSGNPGVYSNGYFYYVSGCSAITSSQCTTFKTDADYVPINNGGSGATGTGTTSGNNFTTARAIHASVIVRGYLYVIAGCTATSGSCTTVTSNVQKTAIASDGSIGVWSDVTAVSNSIIYHQAVTYNDHIYVIGGNDLTSAISTVEYTKVKADGTFEAPTGCGTTWCAATSLPSARSSHTAVVYNGYIYIVGGNTSATVLYIKINSDASLPASWSTGTSMSAARNAPNVVAHNGYLYVLGGESAPLSTSDGSVGSWTTITQLGRGVSSGGFVQANGYAYITGGGTADGNIQYAPLLANGKTGKWDFAVNKLSATRTNSRSAYYNGRVYATGGNSGPTLLASTQYFGLESIPRTGTFSSLVDFDNGVKPTKLITRGTKRSGSTIAVNYKSVSGTSTTFSNDQTTYGVGYDGANAMSFSLGSGVTLSRYLLVRYTLDDSLSAIFPDSGNESTIYEYDLYFISNPGARLRGGRTFVDGTSRGLDAQPQ